MFTIIADSAVRLQSQAPGRKESNALYDQLVAAALKNYDANDYLYWWESSWDYDPEPGLGRITAPLLAVNFADDLINPSELGVMEKLVPRVAKGRSVLVPRSERTIGHMTQTQAAVWRPYLEQLLGSLPE
jgi:homoserine O-acetyltransferase